MSNTDDEALGYELTRQIASVLQINAALEHFHKYKFECAITLASAAEGILPNREPGGRSV
jgi:hypothetical protein